MNPRAREVKSLLPGLYLCLRGPERTNLSVLQYLGDGYWQYNWKTLKSYSGCRIMYVKFLGGQQTQNVTFNFK